MKRIFLTVFFAVYCCPCFSQTWPNTTPAYYTMKKPADEYKVKYRGSVNTSLRFGDPFVGRYGITMVNGISVGDYFSAGLGTGIFYYTQRYYKESWHVPIFLNLETNLTKGHKLTPYLDVNVGYSSLNSFFVAPSAGVKLDLDGKRALKFSFGYNYERYTGSLDKMYGNGEVVREVPELDEFGNQVYDENGRPVYKKVIGDFIELDDVRKKLKGFVFSIGFQF